MIQFHCRCRKAKSRTPIISDLEIENWADAVLEDYKPAHLREPGVVNALHFVESYLEAAIDYQDIFYSEGEPAIIGATAFNEGYVRVFDRERKRITEISVSPRTVILDNSIMAADKRASALSQFCMKVVTSSCTRKCIRAPTQTNYPCLTVLPVPREWSAAGRIRLKVV